ncbi:hypothetical protein FSP39_005256 [Pinctada imbricata]|uniref:Vacuolar protein sorting-associated protein 52 homolog n=1 Tax=Pinctada imbricata TaxID=66713 RepID=A0AA89BLU6_PINIB|nr:hypothetical protein FSP39_005256 [Pinctada imbricata]
MVFLQRMEQMLNGFQGDLSSISTEIQSLQEQSVSMNVKLKNRQAVRGELSQFVDEMVIPEHMINHILDSPVTEREFLEQLHELNHKINFVKEQSFKEARSSHDVKDILEKLKIKAIHKIREYLLQKIYSFRKPMSNYQVPQNAMLKFRFFNEFLMANERHVAREVRDEYLDTMGKVYYSYFKGYLSRLMKLQFQEVADKDDLMGVEDTAKKNILFIMKFSCNIRYYGSRQNRSTVFTLGNRGDILNNQLEAPIIVPHAQQKADSKFTFESLFRSLHYALMDNSCREYLFLVDFFMASGSAAFDLFNAIMGKTLQQFIKTMEEHVNECYDSIAIFLSMHIMYRFRSIMHKRSVPALDRYWDAMSAMMWPRLEYVLHLNIQSVRDVDPQRFGHIDNRPHYVSCHVCLSFCMSAMMWPRLENVLHLNIQSVRDVDPQRFGHIDNRPHYVSSHVCLSFCMSAMMWPRLENVLHLNIQSVRDVDPQRFGHIDNRPHYVSSHVCLSFCMSAMMWPRLENVLHLNIQSVRDVDPQRFGHIDNRPHYVSCHVCLSFCLCAMMCSRLEYVLHLNIQSVRDIDPQRFGHIDNRLHHVSCHVCLSFCMSAMMWPRLEYVLHLNIQSVRDVDPQRFGHIDNRPHYITRRYAEFCAAIVGINQSYPDDRVDRLLGQLQTEVENFILKMACRIPTSKETVRTQRNRRALRNFLTARTQEFIEEVLAPHFGGMMSFVKDCEVLMERGGPEALKNEEHRVQMIVRGFNKDWKSALEVINGDVMRAFTNFKNGTQILQGALTQLIQYYHRFQKVLSQGPFRNLQIRNELINIHHVMVEVKKYKPTF